MNWNDSLNNDDSTIYRVVVNHEEQYSIWPTYKDNPLGWTDAGKTGLKAECLDYIKEVWTDIRPLSLRKKMEEFAKNPPPPSVPPDPNGPRQKSLVERLCEGDHAVEVDLRPVESVKLFTDAIDRDYVHINCTQTKGSTLLTALSILLRGLHSPSQAEGTISSSFESAVKGLRAERGGLYLIRHQSDSVALEILCTVGMTQSQICLIQRGKDSDDIAAGHIWKELATHARVHDARSVPEQPHRSLQRIAPDLYILCVVIDDPVLDTPVAVLYFEKQIEIDPGFEALANEWINAYALALGQIIHLGFRREQFENTGTDRPGIQTLERAPELVGVSFQTQALREELHQIHIPAASAPDPDPILVLGEKGTGKDLVARYIYAYSSRHNRPYVAVNCAEITDELATARFFGHKRGSFTGSLANEPGLFRAANRGVLFLDEIGDLSLRAQGTLLRVLENRTVVPLGETSEQKVDVQVILGTNCDPEQAVAEGRMRPDLLDRFRTQAIRLAPLRERPWDIPALVRHFITHHEKRTQKKILALHADVLKMMVGYSWPGNVRELARVCSLLITHVKAGDPIDAALFNRLVPHIAKQHRNPKAGSLLAGDVPMREALETFGRDLILARLRQHNGNIKSARESLGLPKTTFHRYTRALGIGGAVRYETGDRAQLQHPQKAPVEDHII